ncbi:hypothetical protein LJC18_04445 [Lachnospiraceae bacterium OttesenSCG-928-E19]|nr:hypothetical protein [Lachnospiraceae bacterium OttesenSCG-928-E19]
MAIKIQNKPRQPKRFTRLGKYVLYITAGFAVCIGIQKCGDQRSRQHMEKTKTARIVDAHIKSKYPQYDGTTVKKLEEQTIKELKSLRNELSQFGSYSPEERIIGYYAHDKIADLRAEIEQKEELLNSIQNDKKTLYLFSDSVSMVHGDMDITPFLQCKLGKVK